MNLDIKLADIFNVEDSIIVTENNNYGFTMNLIESTKSRPYKILYTSGLSNFDQKSTEKFPEFKHIELYFCLPDYWDLQKNDWPITWLNKLAEIPQKNNTWFGPGDTIPAGKPAESINEKFSQNHFMLVEPMLFKDDIETIEIDDKAVKFLAVIPIYQNELEYKLKSSAKVFVAKYQFKKYNELVDEYRLNISKSMKWKKIGTFVMYGVIVIMLVFMVLSLLGVFTIGDPK